MMSDSLDKIFELGFEIRLDWREDFLIYYNATNVIPDTPHAILILECSYYNSIQSYTYAKMVECCCDLFYEWYNKNIDKIKNFDKNYDTKTMEILENCAPRNVTKQVARDLNLSDLLDMFDKKKKVSE